MDNNKSQQQNNGSDNSPKQVLTSMEILYKDLFAPEEFKEDKDNEGQEDVQASPQDKSDGTPKDKPDKNKDKNEGDAPTPSAPPPDKSEQLVNKEAGTDTPAPSNNNEETIKYKEFIKELKANPTKAWQKFEKDLELPPLEIVQQIIKTSGSLDESNLKTQLKIFQKNLKNEIEKEFNLDPGTFRYDADEAVDVDSPSYAFADRSRRYEEQLRNELQNKLQFAREQAELMRKVQEEDKKWFKETFYKDQPEKADEAIKNLSTIPAKILSGELPPHKHPFSLRTMLLGIYFDDLVEKIKKETEDNIKHAYEERGMFLNKKAPEDLKKNARGAEQSVNPFVNSTNPMERHIGSIINK